VITASKDGTARIWDANTGLPVGEVLRHQADVTWAAISPDNQQVVTSSRDQTARLWDARTGQPTSPLLQHNGEVLFAEFSPDGQKVVTASRDKTVRLWRAATGSPIASPIMNRAEVRFARFSPDGTMVVAVDKDGAARIFEVDRGMAIASFPHSWYDVGTAPVPQFSPDARQLVTLEVDDAVVWDVRSKTATLRLRHSLEVTSAEFSPDGKLLATASIDNVAHIWDAHIGDAVTPPLRHDNWVTRVQFSADGTRLVTGSTDGTTRIWDARTGRPVAEPMRLDSRKVAPQLSPDGQHLLTSAGGPLVWLWDVRCAPLPFVKLWHSDDVRHAVFSPDGQRVATAARDKTARVWDARSGRELTVPLKHEGQQVWCVAFSPDSQRLATASEPEGVRIWEVATGKSVLGPLKSDNNVRKFFYRVQFSPDGKRVVTACPEQAAWVWDAISGKLVWQLRHADEVSYAQFSRDSQRIVTASADKTARVWDATTGQPLTGPLAHEAGVRWADFSPDGKRVVTISTDKTSRIWDARTGQMLTPPLLHADEPYWHESVRFSSDGQWIATAAGNVAQVWDAHTGQSATTPLKHNGRVNSVKFSPDGKRLVTSCYDGAARIWDAATGHLLSESMRHGERVQYAEFSPDGRWVLTASSDNTAGFWEVPLAPLPIPEWLPELAEAVAGQRIHSQDMSTVVPVQELFELKEKLSRSRGTSDYERWVKWFLADSATRTLSPSSPVTGANQSIISLSGFYHGTLTNELHAVSGNDLRALSPGIQTLAGVQFDLRGFVALSSSEYKKAHPANTAPLQVTNIPVNLLVSRLHFLHGTGWKEPNGMVIGFYVLRYADGQTAYLPLVYGRDLRDWWNETPGKNAPALRDIVAWSGENVAATKTGAVLQLYKFTCENPRPAVRIKSIDFVSAMTKCAPFLIAITVEIPNLDETRAKTEKKVEPQSP
jgi:WD40 repeat protein